ncbi:DUF2977 domain-containing protein, partial [Lactiplantibacillus plantarum]
NVTVDDDTVPVDFSTNFSDDGRWLYKDNQIVKNPDYVTPDTPQPVPTAEQQAIAKLTTLVTGLMAKEAVNNA